MERINLKKITKTLKYLQRITGGLFTPSPADVIVQITVKRYGKEMKITFDRTGEMAEIIYNIGGQTVMEHIREPKTIQEVIKDVLKKPIPVQNPPPAPQTVQNPNPNPLPEPKTKPEGDKNE